MKDKEVIGVVSSGIDAAAIAAAKEKYGADKVKIIDLPTNEDETEFMSVLAVVPSRKIVGQYQRYSSTDPNKADEILVKNCLLTGLDAVLADDGLFYGAVTGIAQLIPIRKGIVKNV